MLDYLLVNRKWKFDGKIYSSLLLAYTSDSKKSPRILGRKNHTREVLNNFTSLLCLTSIPSMEYRERSMRREMGHGISSFRPMTINRPITISTPVYHPNILRYSKLDK